MLKKEQLSAKQERAIDRLYEHDTTILIGSTGLGKTVITLSAISELLEAGVLRRVVVACPAKVVANWPKEAAKWDHLKHLRVVALDGTAEQRSRLVRSGADVFVVSLNNFEWFAAYKGHGCEGVVVDELSKACGKQTAALKTKAKGDCFKWRVGMTATPVSENFQKLYGMCRIMDNGKALGKNKQKYLQQHFISDFMGYNWELMDGHDKIILDKVKHLIYMVKDEKATELPPIEYKTIEFDMPEETQAVYDKMKKDMVVGDVEAVNAAVKSGKLRQIASGFLYKEDGSVLRLDYARLDAMTQWCRSLSKETTGVIFYEFDEHSAEIMAYLSVEGLATKDPDKFKTGKFRWLVIQYQSGSHGLDGLQDVCCNGYFYHPLWSNDAFEQSCGRLWRTGQLRPVTMTTGRCKQSLDPLVMQRVEGKGDFMKLFKKHLNEQ